MYFELFILVVLFLLYSYKYFIKPNALPPGTFGYPVLGWMPSAKIPISDYVKEMKKRYGPIFTTKWGKYVVVMLTDPASIKKAFEIQELQGRPRYALFPIYRLEHNLGILFSDGDRWKTNRRFTLHNLRDLGMGKSILESSIVYEVEQLVEHLEQNVAGKPAPLDWAVNIAVLNVIWQMIASERYGIDDSFIREMFQKIVFNSNMVQERGMIIILFPWLLNVLPKRIYDAYIKHDKIVENQEFFYAHTRKLIASHLETMDRANPRDLIDLYLTEKQDEGDTNYNDLFNLIEDLFVAGSETTSNTIRWVIIFMALNPDAQAKVHAEMDEVVPRDRLPSLGDKQKLPMLEACILEAMRLSPQLGIGLPHRVTKTIQFEGHTIPEDTVLYQCIDEVHRDPKHWAKPDEFYPEHFIDQDGKLNPNNPAYMPFALGRRRCVGESLAKEQVFMFVSAILHRFSILPPPGENLTTEKIPSLTLLNTPKPHNILLQKRVKTLA